MKELFLLLPACLGLLLAAVQDESTVLKPAPDAISEGPQIIFPTIPVIDEKDIPEEDLPVPPPRPKRGPEFVSKLNEETWLVIESPGPLMIFDFPEGLVEIDSDDGARPMKVKGKFADGTGKVETRTFTSKHLYFVNAVKAGQMEMLIIPEGAISKTQSQRHKIVVMGQGPIPPPDPDPEPEPEPEPMPVPTGNVVISIVEDAQNRKPDTAILLNAMAGWNALKDAGNDWRLYDVATSEPKGKQAVEDAKSAELPAMIIRDKETDKILRVIPLPKDFDSLKRILSELGVKCV
jgi:hypothetical protein